MSLHYGIARVSRRVVHRSLGLVLVAVIAGCAAGVDPVVNPPASVTLAPGEGALISGSAWSVRFDSMLSDNRCPVEADCFIAGNAVLAMELASVRADPRPQDAPHFALADTGSVVVENFRFTLTRILPVVHAGKTIDPRDYRATIQIETVPASP